MARSQLLWLLLPTLACGEVLVPDAGLPDASLEDAGAAVDADVDAGLTDLGSPARDSGPRDFAVLVSVVGSGHGLVTSSPSGIECGDSNSACTARFLSGTRVVITAQADEGSIFAGWAGACQGSQDCLVDVESATEIVGRFERREQTLTLTRSGPGLGDIRAIDDGFYCNSDCTVPLVEGSTLAISAVPREHYRFAGWAGDCSGLDPVCELSVTGPLSADARFEFVPKLVSGLWHSCATNEFGALRCWGQNDVGQLGYGHLNDVGGPQQSTALAEGDVSVGALVEDIGIGGFHTCVVIQGGGVRCWGLGTDGQLGYGSTSSLGGSSATLASAAGSIALLGPAIEVRAGFAHSCARLRSGQVQCWGSNSRGQLGYGDVARVGHQPGAEPAVVGAVPVGGLVDQLVVGGLHTCALVDGGTVRCWGRNNNGQLGSGATPETVVGVGRNNTPAAAEDVPVGGLVRRLSSSGGHVCALQIDGQARCWGLGLDGRLGYGSENDIGHSGTTPQMAGTLDLGLTLVRIEAGQTQTCALFEGGTIKCWGDDRRAALGYGPPLEHIGDDSGEVSPNLPILNVGGVVSQVSVGGFFSCARLSTGLIRCWGEGITGALGNGLSSWDGAPADAPVTPVF